MTMTTMTIRRTTAALSIVAALTGCNARTDTSAAPAQAPAATTPAAPAPISIELAAVQQKPLDVQLTIPGELRAYQSVDIHSKADADRGTFDRLKAASATPGVVAGNDVLVAEKTADSSRNEMLAAEQGVEAAKQTLAATRDLEAYLRIAAPFEGVVTTRYVHPGALVGSAGNSPIVTIAQTRRLRLVVPLPEAYTGQVTPNSRVPFTVAAYPGRTWQATVARIADAIDATTRTMAVELDVDNDGGKLTPGTFCQVRWPVTRAEPSLFVPSGSVASTTGRTFVIRIAAGKAEWVDVKTGLSAGNTIEVFGNLKAGDRIAARGTDEVRPGTPVTPKS